MTTYGSFPGVRVDTAGGGITAVAVGGEEKLVVFGAAAYAADDTVDGSASAESPEQISARREADTKFGADSELADGLREALANGANIDYLYGVAPTRNDQTSEVQSTQSGTLDNAPIVEDLTLITVTDTGTGSIDTIEFRYDGAPAQPSGGETMYINPLTGDYAADAAPDTDYEFDYKWLGWDSAFSATDVTNVVDEDDTAVYDALTDSDAVSTNLDSQASSLRTNEYKLVSALSGAEPNDNSSESPPDARYDPANYDTANQSVDSDYYFKFAPVRLEDSKKTILGGVGGLFAGNDISNPIYNDALTGYGALEQSFTKTDADNMRDENVIPIREAGSIRVKDNISTSTATDWERDFWRRRITDRVILIGKTIGDTIIGRINDPETRAAAERLIEAELRELVDDRLIKPNSADTQNWFVDVYEDSTNSNEVNIDIGFTPFGIVKRVDENITINT